MKTTKIEISLPFFLGFYESPYDISDMDIESELQGFEDEFGLEGLTADDLEIDYGAYKKMVGKEFAQQWKEFAPSSVKSVNFKEVYSPRFYNFSTDEIIAEIELAEDWKKEVDAFVSANIEMLEKRIKEDWTSRDGFVSFIENNLAKWAYKIYVEEDARYIGFMIQYMMEYTESSEVITDTLVDKTMDKIWCGACMSLRRSTDISK